MKSEKKTSQYIRELSFCERTHKLGKLYLVILWKQNVTYQSQGGKRGPQVPRSFKNTIPWNRYLEHCAHAKCNFEATIARDSL